MPYSIDETDPRHILWLHGPGISMHDPRALIERLSDEMRRVATMKGARGRSPKPVMRAAMLDLMEEAEAGGFSGNDAAVQVFASLDCELISQPRQASLHSFPANLWNGIVHHIRPKHLDALLASGRSVTELPYPDGLKHLSLPEETGRHFADLLPTGLSSKVIQFLGAAAIGEVPADVALIAVRKWLEAPDIMPGGPSFISSHSQPRVTLRLIAAREAGIWDDWQPDHRKDFARALELTRSNHGRLRLQTLIPDLTELIARPYDFYSQFVG